MAGTLADLLTRIQDEIQRTDLATETALVVTDSINYFQLDAFYLSDNFSTTNLVSGTQVYTLPTDFAWERDAYVTMNGERYEVRKVAFEFLIAEDSNQSSPTLGSPIDYAIFNNSFYLFPRPDGNNTYTFQFSYVSMIPAPATPSTTGNFWMTTAEPVIRNWSKYLLYNEVMQQPDLAKQFQDRAMEAHYKLRELTAQRKWTGNIAPTKF